LLQTLWVGGRYVGGDVENALSSSFELARHALVVPFHLLTDELDSTTQSFESICRAIALVFEAGLGTPTQLLHPMECRLCSTLGEHLGAFRQPATDPLWVLGGGRS